MFFSDNDGNQFKIKGSINCKSVCVIYWIFCKKCSKNIHVGQTGDTFYQRMLLNFSKIRTRKITDPIAKHFCEKDHSVNNYRVIGIERVYGDTIYRETKEAFWIKKLKTYEPQGLNTKLLCRWPSLEQMNERTSQYERLPIITLIVYQDTVYLK